MYVKTTCVRRGIKTYEYLTLVEAVREGGKVGHRVLFRLGEAEALRRTRRPGAHHRRPAGVQLLSPRATRNCRDMISKAAS